MKTFFTADWHLGDKRLELLQRPFDTALEHAGKLMALHNAAVAPDDAVIVVGDACHDPSYLPLIKDFRGKKTLIRGNYDRQFSDADLSKYFDAIVPEGDGIEMEYEGLELWATHYPTRARKDRFNLVGHIHASWKVQLNCLNVGVDVHHFRPLPIEKVPFFHRAVCEFYDEDCWAAYHEANSSFRGTRGKRGSYLDAGKAKS